MNKLKKYIQEKLIINKHSKSKNPISTEDVLVLDGITGSYGTMTYAYDLNLLITGLEHMRDDNNVDDITIIAQGYHDIDRYYVFHKDNKFVWMNYTNKKYQICNLMLYHIDKRNYNMLDSFIDELNKKKSENNKYIRGCYDDMPNYSYRYLYVWYSKSTESVYMYFSHLDYKTLQEQNKFI